MHFVHVVYDGAQILMRVQGLFICTSKMVRGVGLEPTKAYATGCLSPAADLKCGTNPPGLSCPFDLFPAQSFLDLRSREPPLSPRITRFHT